MDRVTQVATTAMELLGLVFLVAALGIAADQHWGLPAALLAAGLALIALSGVLAARHGKGVLE